MAAIIIMGGKQKVPSGLPTIHTAQPERELQTAGLELALTN